MISVELKLSKSFMAILTITAAHQSSACVLAATEQWVAFNIDYIIAYNLGGRVDYEFEQVMQQDGIRPWWTNAEVLSKFPALRGAVQKILFGLRFLSPFFFE